jgi:formylglycine-generating enzyme
MQPYPYGFRRDAEACNIDRTDLGQPRAGLRDHRAPVGKDLACTSPFGVRDLVGNLEEWATRDPGTHGHETLLKGSWWLPGRSTCRATNAGHDEVYEGPETGYRCCL